MPSIIIASDKLKTGKTMVTSVFSSYANLKGISTSIMDSYYNDFSNFSTVPDWVEMDRISGIEGSIPEKISDKDIQDISKKISSASNQKLLITESHLVNIEDNKRIAEFSKSKVVMICDFNSDIKKIKEELGGVFGGIIFNNVPRHKVDILKSETSLNSGIISIIPENRNMVASTVDQYTDHLKGKYLYESERKNDLVLNVLIGGIVLDWSVLYYQSKSDVLALIRGDRPDLQLGAMQAGGNVKGLVLTKGIEPIEYVTYEAEKQRIPLILVNSDTHETADLISGIVAKSKFDHPLKLESCSDYFNKNLRQDVVDKVLDLTTL